MRAKPDIPLTLIVGTFALCLSGCTVSGHGLRSSEGATRDGGPEASRDVSGAGSACLTNGPDGDSDGTPDCDDLCPTDSLKTEPGPCGCHGAETDSDGDGTPNCIDACPYDPHATRQGTCSCSSDSRDWDSDGTADCHDSCPQDGHKTVPGSCGCGTPDLDSDTDGAPDCQDLCPNDRQKTTPGECGCGSPENCEVDSCPGDPKKTEPGQCGCNLADVDTDGDGIADCNDECPQNAERASNEACDCRGALSGGVCTTTLDVQDAFVVEYFPDLNVDNEYLQVDIYSGHGGVWGSSAGGRLYALLKPRQFPLSVNLQSAVLNLFIPEDVDSAKGQPIEFQVLNKSWRETTVTYNTAPNSATPAGGTLRDSFRTRGPHKVDVTRIALAWVRAGVVHGMALLPVGKDGVILCSTEHPVPSQRPTLQVTWLP